MLSHSFNINYKLDIQHTFIKCVIQEYTKKINTMFIQQWKTNESNDNSNWVNISNIIILYSSKTTIRIARWIFLWNKTHFLLSIYIHIISLKFSCRQFAYSFYLELGGGYIFMKKSNPSKSFLKAYRKRIFFCYMMWTFFDVFSMLIYCK